MTSFSQKLQAKLEELKITPKALSKQSGIPINIIRDLIKGKNCKNNGLMINKICQIINLTPEYLTKGQLKTKQKPLDPFSLVNQHWHEALYLEAVRVVAAQVRQQERYQTNSDLIQRHINLLYIHALEKAKQTGSKAKIDQILAELMINSDNSQ